MEQYIISDEGIRCFCQHLRGEERELGTIEKYRRDVRAFADWMRGKTVTKELVMAWKEHLCQSGYSPATINSMLVALNRFFRFWGWGSFQVRALRIQRRMFRNREKELTQEEYTRLVETARGLGKERLALLMETICATGIRVSEVKYITVEAVQTGRAEVSLKGKIRTILIPNKLCRKLQKYAGKQKTASGEIFLTRSGRGLSRRGRAGPLLRGDHPHLPHLLRRRARPPHGTTGPHFSRVNKQNKHLEPKWYRPLG